MPIVNIAPVLPPPQQATPIVPANPGNAVTPPGPSDEDFASTLDKQLKHGNAQSDAAETTANDPVNTDPAAASAADPAAIAAAMLANLAAQPTQTPPPQQLEAEPAEGGLPQALPALSLDTPDAQTGAAALPQTETPDTLAALQSPAGAANAAAPGADEALAASQASGNALPAAVKGSEAQREMPSFEAALQAAQNPLQGAAAQAASSTEVATPRTEVPQYAVRTPVGHSQWAGEVGNRMVWMSSKNLDQAQLVLTPPHLGRVEIKLSIAGDQATAAFTAATPAAREAIEQSLPRLREVMSQAGLDLGQVNVSANSAGQEGQQRWQGLQANGGRQGRGDFDAEVPGEILRGASLQGRAGVGMVDTFA